MKFPNSGIGIMQDVPQIEAFSIPLHVELTELLGFDFDLVQNCVGLAKMSYKPMVLLTDGFSVYY